MTKHPAPAKPVADDDDAFAREMRDVVRIDSAQRGRVRRGGAPISPGRHTPQPPEPAHASVDEFVANGVDRREIRKLRKGDYAVRGRLDLHGMTSAEALPSARRFLERSRHAGHRCVSIIHGRGLHSHSNQPILKQRVREYLRSDASVLAFTDAPAADGGSGAVYVLLRK